MTGMFKVLGVVLVAIAAVTLLLFALGITNPTIAALCYIVVPPAVASYFVSSAHKRRAIIGRRTVQPERQWVTPADIVKAAIDRASGPIADRVVVDADDNIEGEVDLGLASAALTHVIESALQYAPVASRITVRGTADYVALRFVVTDEGPGFDNQNSGRAADAPDDERAADRVRSSSGPGLTIARDLLRLRGQAGTIQVETISPQGARVSIALPASQRPCTFWEAS